MDMIFNNKIFIMYLFSMFIGILAMFESNASNVIMLFANHWPTLIPQNVLFVNMIVFTLKIKDVETAIKVRQKEEVVYRNVVFINLINLMIYYIVFILLTLNVYSIKIASTGDILLIVSHGLVLVIASILISSMLIISKQSSIILALLTVLSVFIYHYSIELMWIVPAMIRG